MFSMQEMMRQAHAMQEKMQRIQAEAEVTTVQASGAGGLVQVVMTGKGMVHTLAIDPSLINPAEKDVLEDVLKAALNDAKRKADELIAKATTDAMGPLAGKIKLPF